jgi:hypothetical protein
MCLLKVLDHTGRGGCGHFFIIETLQCTQSRFRQSQEYCINPTTRILVPSSKLFRDLMRWFEAGHNKVAGKCPVCYGGMSENAEF